MSVRKVNSTAARLNLGRKYARHLRDLVNRYIVLSRTAHSVRKVMALPLLQRAINHPLVRDGIKVPRKRKDDMSYVI